ncbi:MAG: cytochrome c oxidase subunit 3 [Alphaproteobacteria bacterium]|jgi:cytochrome c oxidase subunit 3|nr:cytochrome c oxidase subunit 3 [Alphaproteobacteria bacterium]
MGLATHTTNHKHPYHLVNPSPWPILGSFSAGLLAVGGLLYMHNVTPWLLYAGAFMVLLVMFLWWRDVVHESIVEKAHTDVVKIGLRFGMVLFIASEVMFFAAFFWAYFNASLFPTEAIGSVWPPQEIKTFDPFDLPLMNTLILLLSGTTVTWAHHAIIHGDRKGALQGLAATIILGLFFTVVQVYEYTHAAFGFRDGIYASTFYMATGFHGAHVIIGTIFLIVCFFRAYKGHFTPERHFGFEAAAWYWHFVDVVWLFLFVAIYVTGAGTPVAH